MTLNLTMSMLKWQVFLLLAVCATVLLSKKCARMTGSLNQLCLMWLRQLANVFGKASLWLAFLEKVDDVMLVTMSAQIKSAHASLSSTIPDGENPVHRRLVIVTSEGATVQHLRNCPLAMGDGN